ncbi:MAG TPA: nuclease-related domain-containing protein [Solirubrobacteraceae bacterium]|nr:nuclease-related domain-containing protein [Solirubrobacteraceae bacterium]
MRQRHPYLGPLLLALRGSPQHEQAFQQGGLGEETIARSLQRRVAKGPARLLHDRRMPGGFGNIDHLAVAPRGVYVIDAKAIKGKVRVLQGAAPKLQINGRTRNKLIAGLERQVLAVQAALDATGHRDVPLTGTLCFTEADFPLFGRMQIGEYLLRHRRALGKELTAPGPLTAASIDELARCLGEQFPPA